MTNPFEEESDQAKDALDLGGEEFDALKSGGDVEFSGGDVEAPDSGGDVESTGETTDSGGDVESDPA